MKDEFIKLRISAEVKAKFKEICDLEHISMSEKIIDYITKEIKRYGSKEKL